MLWPVPLCVNANHIYREAHSLQINQQRCAFFSESAEAILKRRRRVGNCWYNVVHLDVSVNRTETHYLLGLVLCLPYNGIITWGLFSGAHFSANTRKPQAAA
jgi:hypothetical protein